MTREKLVSKVAAATGTNKVLVDDIMLSIMTHIKQELVDGETIYLRGFGTFTTVLRAAKAARNISAGEQIRIPARTQPVFKFTTDLKEAVAKGGRVRARLAQEARKRAMDVDNEVNGQDEY